MSEFVLRMGMMEPAEPKAMMTYVTIEAAIRPQEHQLKQVFSKPLALRPPDLVAITRRALTGT
jgi:hypothetical protein